MQGQVICYFPGYIPCTHPANNPFTIPSPPTMHEDHLLKGSSVSPLQSLVAGSISGAVARYVYDSPREKLDNQGWPLNQTRECNKSMQIGGNALGFNHHLINLTL